MYRTDFHTHILPFIDDGARSPEESAEMLVKLKKSGVNTVFLTPHYRSSSLMPDSFLSERKRCFECLKEYLEVSDCSVPDLILGCELYLTEEIFTFEDFIPQIAADDTLLLELPYEEITSQSRAFFRRAFDFVKSLGYKVCLAHLERFLYFADEEELVGIAEDAGAPVQVNCRSFYSGSVRRGAGIQYRGGKAARFSARLLKEGYCGYLGTDCHNMTDRVPDFGEAEEFITGKISAADFEHLMSASADLISRMSKDAQDGGKIYSKSGKAVR